MGNRESGILSNGASPSSFMSLRPFWSSAKDIRDLKDRNDGLIKIPIPYSHSRPMPLTDFPLEKLRTYRGITARPADFDAYWTSALAELDALDPQLQLAPADHQFPGAECFLAHWNGVGNARLHAKYLRPAGVSAPHSLIIIFHGYSGFSGDWVDKLAWVAMGFSVLAVDVRGQSGLSDGGGSTRGKIFAGLVTRGLAEGSHALYFRHVFQDAALAARIAMQLPHVDPARIVVKGDSQGGGLAIACAALEPRIAAAASLYPFLSDYRRVWEMDLAENAYEDIRKWFREYDPLHEREDWFFEQLGYIDVQHLAPRVRGRVIMGVGLADKVCPPSTQFAIFNRLECEKKMLVYPDFGHENIRTWADDAAEFLVTAIYH
ncbi:acetylxylan esterase [soil metagenome]